MSIPSIEGDDRMTALPVRRHVLWKYYQDAVNSSWTAHEIAVSQDAVDWYKLSPQLQRCVKYILGFFAAGDNIVNVNITERFLQDVKIYEATRFYNAQVYIEDIHAHMYAILLETIIPDAEERTRIVDAVKNIPTIGEMTRFMTDTISADEPFPNRLLRMACVEGVFFTSCFCIIYWLQTKQLMPGLGHSNELIARDEMLHTTFALELYTMCDVKPDNASVYAIFDEAVKIAVAFARDAIQDGIPELNITLMEQYIKCCADNLLSMISVPPLYNTKNEFHFMDKINLKGRTNFFERRVSEYGKTQSSSGVDEVDTDF
jgi:ribonucleotide reductase beta subunit family protein with ferritin-like domain